MRKFLLGVLGLGLFFGLIFSQEVVVKKYVVAIQDANVRSMPSAQGEIVFVLHAGEKAELVQDMGTWLKVRGMNGAVGYVWAKLVRVEIERVIRSAPKAVPPSSPSPKPVQRAVASPKAAQFGLSFNFTYALVSPDDFNAMGRFYQHYIDYVYSKASAYYTIYREGELNGLKHLLGGEVEVEFYPSENIGVGLGFSFNNGNVSEATKLSDPAGNYMQVSQDLKASVYGPYLGLHFLIPAQMISLELFANAGYYFGSFDMKYSYSSTSVSAQDTYMEGLKKSSLGFGGGGKLNIKLSPNAGIFIAGKYQFVKFSDIEGHYRDVYGSYDGTLYNYELNTPWGWLPVTRILETEPAPDPDIRNVRKAELNFSGFYLSAGFFLRF